MFSKNRNYFLIQFVILFLTFISLSSCLEDRPSTKVDMASAASSWFEGVSSVTNLGGDPISIKVAWTAVSQAAKYRVYAVVKGQTTSAYSLSLIEEITDPTTTSFIHRDAGTITAGAIYTYMVKAVDSSGNEDPNLVQKSTIAFAGIDTVDLISNTSAKVYIVKVKGSFYSLKAIAHPTRLADTDTSADVTSIFTTSSSDSQYYFTTTLDGLRTGTIYNFKVVALVNDGGDVDGNSVTIKKATPSESFGTGTDTNYQYRGVRLVQGFGSAPNELNTKTIINTSNIPSDITQLVNPHRRMIKIIPNPFSVSGNFRVIRTAGVGYDGNTAPDTFDTTTSTICSKQSDSVSATATSCVVCDHKKYNTTSQDFDMTVSPSISNGDCDLNMVSSPPSFIDISLDAPPRKYYYAIVKVKEYNSIKWPEELPTTNWTQYLFSAHVPDSNMILVQRDSVNYEMCKLLNSASDPLNHNRCKYSGIGGIAYDQFGRAKTDNGYYDFGYNLLVDRHPLSCAWTTANKITATGSTGALQCGKSSTAPGCFSLGLKSLTYSSSGYTTGSTSDSDSSNASLNQSVLKDVAGTSNFNNYNYPTPTFTFNSAYLDNPLVMLSLQNVGHNCYVAAPPQSKLNDTNIPDISSSPSLTISSSASWTAVARVAEVGLGYVNNYTNTTTVDYITRLVSASVTADPGPLDTSNGYTNRKRPVITGLSSTQGTALCYFQKSSYSSGNKRLLRRREFVASTAFPSFDGEPRYTNTTELSKIQDGTAGFTQYNWDSTSSDTYINSTTKTLGNPGGCATTNSTNQAIISASSCYCGNLTTDCTGSYNKTVSLHNRNYCPQATGCTKPYAKNDSFHPNLFTDKITVMSGGGTCDDTTSKTGLDIISAFMDSKNETAQLNLSNYNAMNYTNMFFIGSLATNKCVSRYGIQDPIFSPGGISQGGAFTTNSSDHPYGYVLSDLFAQQQTGSLSSNPPKLKPQSNSYDLAVQYDYTYVNSSNVTKSIFFSSDSDSYIPTTPTGNKTFSSNYPGTYPYNGCTNENTSFTYTWNYYVSNYFYYTASSTVSTEPQCSTDGSGKYTGGISFIPQRSHNDLVGFIPVMGLPLSSNITNVNSYQNYVLFSNFLFANKFGSSPTTPSTYARYLESTPKTGSNTPLINMTTGTGGRWSYEISEGSSSSNNTGAILCGVEAE